MVSLSFLSVACLTFSSSVTKMSTEPPSRHPTLQKLSSTLSSASTLSKSANAKEQLTSLTNAMNDRAQGGIPFTPLEIKNCIDSLKHVLPQTSTIDLDQVASALGAMAHLSHKDWTVTGTNAGKLAEALFQGKSILEQEQMLERILQEGNWQGALEHASTACESRSTPWAVLVTGVNGIRKTSSMYQPWFPMLLAEALVAPCQAEEKSHSLSNITIDQLPSGTNSFFRQLDHMIATLCNTDFAVLYSLTSELVRDENASSGQAVSPDVVRRYSDYKAAIFARYRTLSELLGVILLREAQASQLNCMMETSGRDVAMFHYVDHFFYGNYSKLALHFTINDLEMAKASVDQRMIQEIKAGMNAVVAEDAFEIINANAGGPYGSDVLESVQEASDRVWKDEIMSGAVGKDWYKATIQINAHPTKAWTAQAVRPDGKLGTEFAFELRQ